MILSPTVHLGGETLVLVVGGPSTFLSEVRFVLK